MKGKKIKIPKKSKLKFARINKKLDFIKEENKRREEVMSPLKHRRRSRMQVGPFRSLKF